MFYNVVSLFLLRVFVWVGYCMVYIGKYYVVLEEVYCFEIYLRGNGRNVVGMVENCWEFFVNCEDEWFFFLYFVMSDFYWGGGIDKIFMFEFKFDFFGNWFNW